MNVPANTDPFIATTVHGAPFRVYFEDGRPSWVSTHDGRREALVLADACEPGTIAHDAIMRAEWFLLTLTGAPVPPSDVPRPNSYTDPHGDEA